MTYDVVLMEPLRDDNHGALVFAVESAKQGILLPVIGDPSPCLGVRVFRFHDVVLNDPVGPTNGDCATHRG